MTITLHSTLFEIFATEREVLSTTLSKLFVQFLELTGTGKD